MSQQITSQRNPATDYYLEMLKERDNAHENEVKLLQLRAAVMCFCHQIEACTEIAGNVTDFLQIQINSSVYKQMKSLI